MSDSDIPRHSASADDERVDELASAYLDGELDHADVARVEGDPALAARAAELAAARDALAAPVEIDPAARAAAIAQALEAFGERPPAPVVDLTSRASRRRRRTLAAVAAAAAIAIAVPVVASLQDDENGEDLATGALESNEDDAGDEGTTFRAEADAAPSGGDAVSGALAVDDLGAFDDLADALPYARRASADAAAPSSGAGDDDQATEDGDGEAGEPGGGTADDSSADDSSDATPLAPRHATSGIGAERTRPLTPGERDCLVAVGDRLGVELVPVVVGELDGTPVVVAVAPPSGDTDDTELLAIDAGCDVVDAVPIPAG